MKLVETDHHGIAVSADGRVWSNVRSRGRQYHQLNRWPGWAGYLWVTLRIGGRRTARPVHKLICTSFHGSPPSEKYEVRHLNGDHHDNRADNLAWGTAIDNAADREAHGRTARGERSGAAILTESDVRAIRCSAGLGASHRQLGRNYGVAHSTIGAIVRRETWTHIETNQQGGAHA